MPDSTFMLNGASEPWRAMTLRDVCDHLGLEERGFAVERNGEIIPRSQLANVSVQPNDSIEIVHMVGGG